MNLQQTFRTSRVNEPYPAISSRNLAKGAWESLSRDALVSCRRHGFLCVELDKRQQKLVDASLRTMRTFFAGDNAAKSVFKAEGGGNGWTPSSEEPAYQPGTVSNVESFDITQALIEGHPDPQWPGISGFQQSAVASWRTLLALSDQLLELIGRATGMAPGFLPTNCDSRELNTLRFLHYPPENRPTDAHEVGIAAHTDFECITLLYQSAAGLEVRNVNGHWLEAPADRGRLIVLLGDMLEIWTNGYIQATGHRVRRTTRQRFSIVMFIAANKGIQVQPLSRFVSRQYPAAYLPVEQEAHLQSEMAKATSNLLLG